MGAAKEKPQPAPAAATRTVVAGEAARPATSGAGRRRGRPPALAPAQERRAILEAALRVLRRSGYDRATLDEVLTEAGLSTRAFYRHYTSKDELLVALYEQEVSAVAARLTRLVDAAPGPVESVEAWMNDILGIRLDARRAERAGLFRSREAQRGANWDEIRRATELALTEPLVAALAAGRADGTFPDAVPAADARMIHALTFRAFEDLADQPRPAARREASDHVRRFALRALGAPPR
jgi:AcrR family transcriptional regulator